MKAKVLVMAAVLLCGTALNAAESVSGLPVVVQDTIAYRSRAELAVLLYQRGVRFENAGDDMSALRTYFTAFNLNSGSELIRQRQDGLYGAILRNAQKRYLKALADIEDGRMFAAEKNLKGLCDYIRGLDNALVEKVRDALLVFER